MLESFPLDVSNQFKIAMIITTTITSITSFLNPQYVTFKRGFLVLGLVIDKGPSSSLV